MGCVNPRASGLWEAFSTMSHTAFNEEDIERQNSRLSRSGFDGRTPLDKTIDRIGMGSYQWTLLSLCGFGWLADNMWLQAIAIILPRMQQHFSIPDNYIGAVSSSMFAGMMVGAVGWGTCSDFVGRSVAFNGTLFFTTIFGLLASFSNSFTTICITLFFLGSSVGGSMPTDGTLILENVPKENQYLVTALSAFFSVGSVLAAVVALLVLPGNSCSIEVNQPCDADTQNRGWRYLLICLAILTFVMFLARIVFFRLYESPRYLVHAGRPHEAVKSLQLISKFNGSELSIELADVRDHHCPSDLADTRESGTPLHARVSSNTIFDATIIEDRPSALSDTENCSHSDRSDLVTVYDSTGKTDGLAGLSTESDSMTKDDSLADAIPEQPLLSSQRELRPRRRGLSAASSRRSSLYEGRLCRILPRWLRSALVNWWSRVLMILSPEWLRTTLLVWASWCTMALAYTMFNVYFPKLLEIRWGTNQTQTLKTSLWEIVLFTLGGCPGPFVGAYLTGSRLGRKWSLAGSSFMTALSCIIFADVTSTWAVMLSSIGFNLSSTIMWAILYSWTPDIFETKVRGTACGIASALSRIGGMLAPILGGILLMMSQSIPVYTSAAVFVIAGFCVSYLRDDDRERSRRKAGLH